jgi:hypothetical protein
VNRFLQLDERLVLDLPNPLARQSHPRAEHFKRFGLSIMKPEVAFQHLALALRQRIDPAGHELLHVATLRDARRIRRDFVGHRVAEDALVA